MYYNVVISNSHKYLYYRVPKTATTSIIKYLEKYTTLDIGGTNCENKGYNVDYNDEWNSLFQFIFVRNPWDRILSCFLDKTKQCIDKPWQLEVYKKYFNSSFEEFIHCLNEKNIYLDGHTYPQHCMLNTDNLDFIGKFENLDNDMKILQEKLNLPVEKIPLENITHHDNYRKYYNSNTKNKIEQLYSKDIEIFQYEF